MDDLKKNNLVNVVINLVNTHFMDDLRTNNVVNLFFMDDLKANNLVNPFFINKFWVKYVVYVYFGQEKRVNNIGNQVVNPVYLYIH